MFVVTDCSNGRPTYSTKTNDIKDLGDIILGITGSQKIANQAMKDAGDMHFGDTKIANPYYIIDCVQDEE